MFGFKLYRVRGESMTPTLSAGDLVLLRQREAKTDDIVVVSHPRHGTIIKRIAETGALVGDGPESTKALGPYDPNALMGVAVLAITPAGLRRLSARQSGSRV